MSAHKSFFIGMAESNAEITPELGGSKAALLWRMSRLGLNVPPAFVLPTTLCAAVNRGDAAALAAMQHSLRDGIARLEHTTGRRLGSARAPLLVSVRSGAAKSMPGMLSTILDVGLNSVTVRGLIGLTGNPRLAWDSYRRLVQMYAEVVADVPAAGFETAIVDLLRAEGVRNESELDSEALERLTQEFRGIALHAAGHAMPEEPLDQLIAATRAVYRSWDGTRAKEYRRLNALEGLAGTAVTIQAMVFGNTGGRSGAGVAFTRSPATGAKELYIDFLADAQGEDVVSGRRMPSGADIFAARLPAAAQELSDGAARLEHEFRDIQDIEFTIENGKLFFLQTRSAKRTPRAALRVLVDLVREGLLNPAAALAQVAEIDLDRARLTRFATGAPVLTTAISASPGVASGRAVFDSARAKALAAGDEPVILVRPDISTDDIAGFAAASGILTAVGGRTAHAAVVARQLGKVCLVGCRDLSVHEERHCGEIAGEKIAEGDWLSLDGERGEISLGRREIVTESPEAELAEIARWRAASGAAVA
jgi:pyruvate,orthophosphate dikinase